MSELNLVQDLELVTLFSGVFGFLCQKLGLSSILGFLLARTVGRASYTSIRSGR